MFNRGHWKKMHDTASGPAVASKNKQGKPTYDVDNADGKSFTTDWLATKTIEFINSHKARPFCYMVSIPDPHGPNTVRAPYDSMYDDVQVPVPETLFKTPSQTPAWALPDKKVSEASLRRIMPAYYGMIRCIDDNVGRILNALREAQLLEHTIVVFTADHGDLCGEHKRLNKGVPYEGSAKIPMVVYFPGAIEQGTVIRQALSCVDFAPTILQLMQISYQHEFDGRDASALFRNDPIDTWQEIAVLRGTNDWLCAVTSRYKLVFSSKDRPWLFDLETDPNELENAFDQEEHRVVVQQLANKLIAYVQETNDPRGADPKIRTALKAAAGRQ